MKKFRKGFTLVELLIVISVIGILGAMGMMGGSEANTIATATKITEDLKIISSAMNMYYADNKTACDIGKASLKDDAEDLKATDIRAGTVPYLKSGAYLTADSTPVDGKYTIIINDTDNTWWLAYKIPANDVAKLGAILKNKAVQQDLKASAAVTGTETIPATEEGGQSTTNITDNMYEGGDTVYMRVR